MISKISAAQIIPENILLYDLSREPYILQVEIDPIDYCNHECKWCFTKDMRGNNSIPLIDLKKYLFNFSEYGGKSVVFSGGGEPLLYRQIYTQHSFFDNSSICKFLIDRDVHIGIITNGLLLNRLFDSDFDIINLSFIRVSLDATTAKRHSFLHNTMYGDFNIIINNIKKLSIYRGLCNTPAIGISFIVDSNNEVNHDKKQIKEIRNIACDINVDFVQFKHIHTNFYKLAFENMKKVHHLCQELNWGGVEFWVQLYENARRYNNCLITQYIQSIGRDSKKFPCCHLFGRSELLDQSIFSPIGKKIKDCNNKVCRYGEVNRILSDNFLSNFDKYHFALNESINKYGYHPFRYCPTAPNILKPFNS